MTGTFTAGAVLTAANLNTAINSLTLNAQSGAGYTLVLTDAGKLVTVSNASAQNLTIPLNSSVAFPTGTTIEALNIGAGTWTVTATGGVTLSGTTAIPTNGRVRLTKTGTDTWWSSAMDAAAGGLAFIATSTFSAASSVNVDNCFTSAYDNYRIELTYTASTQANQAIRLRASGSDDSSANYSKSFSGYYITNASASFGNSGNTYWDFLQASSAIYTVASIDVFYPNLSAATVMVFSEYGVNSTAQFSSAGGGIHNVSSAFSGFSLVAISGTMSGTVRVYGYRNSL